MTKYQFGLFREQESLFDIISGQPSTSKSNYDTKPKLRLSGRCKPPSNITTCIFCGQLGKNTLHHVSTISQDGNIKVGIQILQDSEIMARLPPGVDLMAADAVYHLQCLRAFNNRVRSKQREISMHTLVESRDGWLKALEEMYGQINLGVAEGKKYFKLKDLRKRLEEALKKRVYGISYVHQTRLKEAIIGRFPGTREETDGKNVLFVFPDSMKDIMKAANTGTAESDSWILAKAAAIVRREIGNGALWNFSGQY